MASPPTAAQLPTRQQLDEIDALLSRMLTLPPLVGEPADHPASPASAPAAPPAEMTFPAPVIREVPPPRPPSAEDPVVREWRAQWPQTPGTRTPSVVAWGLAVPLATPAEDPYDPVPAPGPVYPPALQSPAYTPPLAQYPTAEAVPADPRPIPRAPVPTALWPLIALNAAIDALCHLLGPVGAWMRGSGRTVLGWVGVAMILAAGVWAAGEWYGYEWPNVGLNLSKLSLSP